ncbi:MAG: MraY family glycosyltransferase [Planctomycetota bacterium]|jgi:UDP-GlcNAc:undecaprenyl-phosphate GlcNAc-1-phosphate transferase
MQTFAGLELSPLTFTAIAAVSSLGAGLACYLLRGPARRWDLVAHSRRDRFGSGHIPLVGGPALAIGCTIALIATRPDAPIAVGALFFLSGLLDDFLDLKPGPKIALQAVAAVLGALMLVSSPLHVGLAVLVLLLFVNACNYLDNMDALLSGVALTQALVLVLVPSGSHFGGTLLLWALPGVFFFTLPPARVYLGDSGSHLIGALLAIDALGLLIDPLQGVRPDRAIGVALLFTVPLADVATVTISRRRRGRPIFRGGTDHISHRMVRNGFSVPAAVGLLVLASAVCGIASLFFFYSA